MKEKEKDDATALAEWLESMVSAPPGTPAWQSALPLLLIVLIFAGMWLVSLVWY